MRGQPRKDAELPADSRVLPLSIMIALPLARELEPIAAAYRRFHFWRGLAVAWAGLFAVAALLLLAGRLGFARFDHALEWLGALAVLTVAAVWIWSRRVQPDFHWIAEQVERRDPRLRTLLLAAIEQEPDPATGQFGYLQLRVINEALEHNSRHPWGRHISDQLFFVQCAHHLALGLLVLALAGHAWNQQPAARQARRLALSGGGVTVTPGDAAVEKGSGLVVMARFDGALPAEATLVVGANAESERRIPLAKNLDDPVFGGSIPEVNADLLYHIEYGGKRTRDFRVTTYEHPNLVRADAKLTYPGYTGLPEKTIEDTRRVSAVEGTELEYAFHLNKPVAKAQLIAKGGEPVELKPDASRPNTYLAGLTLLESRRYELQLVDAEGRANKVPPVIQIDVTRNRPPELKFVRPRKDLRVSPLEEIDFEAEVSDDFGLSAFGIAYSVGGGEPALVELGKTTGPHEKAKARRTVAMEKLGAQPDELLTYYLWADDMGPDGRQRRTASDIFFAEVRPFEEIFRQGQPPDSSGGEQQQRQGGQQQKLTELQKQVAISTWKVKNRETGAKPSEKFGPDVETIKESQALALGMAEQAGERAEDPRAKGILQTSRQHMEKALTHITEAAEKKSAAPLAAASSAAQAALQALLKLQSREHQVVRARGQQGGGGDQQRQNMLNELEFKDDNTRYESQRMARAGQTPQQREELQVLNRLKELAQRQQDLNERIQELQTALAEAKSEEERKEIERRLKRLREEQQQMLADLDELRQRMDRQENQSSMAEARQQLEQTRQNLRNAAENLEQGRATEALAAGTRAQRELQQMREDFRKRTSSQFADAMREMRQEARQLAQKEQDLGRQIEQIDQSRRKSLSDSDERKQIAEQLKQQKSAAGELLKDMRTVTEQAEAAEPLLSRQLYETIRQHDQEKTGKALEFASELLARNFVKEAAQHEQQARESIEQLKRGVERAAESVLGDEAEALRQARNSVDDLARRLEEEIARATAPGTNTNAIAGATAGDPGSTNRLAQARGGRQDEQAGQTKEGQPRQMAQAQSGQPQGQRGEQSQQQGQPPGAQEGQREQAGRQQAQQGQQGQGSQAQSSPQQGRQPGQQSQGAQQAGQQGQRGQQQAQARDGQRGGARDGGARDNADLGGFQRFFDGGGRAGPHGPITGADYTEWTDRLRDVEEMLDSTELRTDAARIRDRVRAERAEFKRHSKEPRWDLITKEVLQPLITLRDRINEELARRESENPLVPIDRDPVPPAFAERVRRYYEQLGGVEKPQAGRSGDR